MITESALRARARRQGYRVVRSKLDGSYGVIDPRRNAWILGDPSRGYGYSFNAVAYFLGEPVEVF